jgi:hypothetical protein
VHVFLLQQCLDDIKKVQKATATVERKTPEYSFPKEWTYCFFDKDEMKEQTDHLHWATMRDKYGWGVIAGITSASLFLRPDVEHARSNNIICRKDILKKGVVGVHMFDNRDKAKEYFKSCYVYKLLRISPSKLHYLESLINTEAKIDTCSICTDDIEPSCTTVTLPCSHTFCYDCVQGLVRSWMSRDISGTCFLECPNCRYQIMSSTVNAHSKGGVSDVGGSSSSSAPVQQQHELHHVDSAGNRELV